MGKTAIMTDSNSGITQAEAAALGITVLPMPFYINNELYFEDLNLTQEEFFKRLTDDAEISTSQPSPADIIATWDKLLKEYDEIVHIPMSSSLSGTCETAFGLAADYNGKVTVIDNRRISVTQRQSVCYAKRLADEGKGAAEIKEFLEKDSDNSGIYLTVQTLKYLKKGGRITPAVAAIGTLLNLKPVLSIMGGRIDAYAKCRGIAQAKKTILEAVTKDFAEKYKKQYESGKIKLYVVYAANKEEGLAWADEVAQQFPNLNIETAPLSLSVACHIGNAILAIAYTVEK